MEHVEVGGGTDGTILSKHAVNASKMNDGASAWMDHMMNSAPIADKCHDTGRWYYGYVTGSDGNNSVTSNSVTNAVTFFSNY